MRIVQALSILLIFLCCMPVADAQVTLGSNSNISYSNPRQYEIGGVSVEGANNLDEGAIRLLSGLNIGDEISVPGDETAEAKGNYGNKTSSVMFSSYPNVSKGTKST